MTMKPMAFAYDADVHCPDCAVEHFGGDVLESSEGLEDSEGNEPHAVFENEEWWQGPAYAELETLTCGACGTILDCRLWGNTVASVYGADVQSMARELLARPECHDPDGFVVVYMVVTLRESYPVTFTTDLPCYWPGIPDASAELVFDAEDVGNVNTVRNTIADTCDSVESDLCAGL